MLYDLDTGWVFEYNKFKNSYSIGRFEEKYHSLIAKKQDILRDNWDQFEEEEMGEDELGQIMPDIEAEAPDLEDKPELILTTEDEIKSDEILIESEIESPKSKLKQDLKIQTITPNIIVPKIRFPKVKIYIPKIYRKKN